ncbi:hypothetical protein CA13_10780 [Planctomycetes bacterium CA13]|uniref:Uncharacterized protein n=1 Tax=Novipirellula herctigrandis TaxID=2527986 RepID=A0A5C5YXC4_9BACT|nr:hypothetical protein CA13_10780 [Planctomycetes bacterium CA13]
MSTNPYQVPGNSEGLHSEGLHSEGLPGKQLSAAHSAAFMVMLLLAILMFLLAIFGLRNDFVLNSAAVMVNPMPTYVLCLPALTLICAAIMLNAALMCRRRKWGLAACHFAASALLLTVVHPILSSALL